MDGNQSISTFTETSYVCERLLEEVRPNIYRSTYSITGFPWAKKLELYVVVEPGKKALFLDTGWDILCGTEHFDEAIRRFNVPWTNAMVFISHWHTDHHGNLTYLWDHGAKVVMCEQLERHNQADMDAFCKAAGYVGEYINVAEQEAPLLYPDFARLDPAEFMKVIDIAGYQFRGHKTPGHTKNQLCLIDPKAGVIYAGDHVVTGNPILSSYAFREHAIKNYIETFPMLKALSFDCMLMAHHDPLLDSDNIWDQLTRSENYYHRGLKKAKRILEEANRPLTVWEFTDLYYMDRGERLADLPAFRKAMRVSARCAYLEYLVDVHYAKRWMNDNGVMLYQAKRI